MSNAPKFLIAVLLCAHCLTAQTPGGEESAKAVVLQKDEGEVRTRRPREGVVSPTSDFMVNGEVSPKTNGSKHLLLGTEEIPPGGVIPKHRHHGEDEILLIETGSAHAWLGDREYDARPGRWCSFPLGLGLA
jgi:quercetin dioxygenase-like cupin family protein